MVFLFYSLFVLITLSKLNLGCTLLETDLRSHFSLFLNQLINSQRSFQHLLVPSHHLYAIVDPHFRRSGECKARFGLGKRGINLGNNVFILMRSFIRFLKATLLFLLLSRLPRITQHLCPSSALKSGIKSISSTTVLDAFHNGLLLTRLTIGHCLQYTCSWIFTRGSKSMLGKM